MRKCGYEPVCDVLGVGDSDSAQTGSYVHICTLYDHVWCELDSPRGAVAVKRYFAVCENGYKRFCVIWDEIASSIDSKMHRATVPMGF